MTLANHIFDKGLSIQNIQAYSYNSTAKTEFNLKMAKGTGKVFIQRKCTNNQLSI
jgi:hypothetical protein